MDFSNIKETDKEKELYFNELVISQVICQFKNNEIDIEGTF